MTVLSKHTVAIENQNYYEAVCHCMATIVHHLLWFHLWHHVV